MTDLPQSKAKVSRFWLILISAVIFSCIVMNAVTILYQSGMFRPWVFLAGPLSGVKRIIDANFNQVWVESQDNYFFRADMEFNCENKDSCRNWQSINNISDLPEQDFPALRGRDCESLQPAMFPRNPSGQILECLYTRLPGAESGSEAYFALMSDGNVLYWWNGGSLIEAQALFILSTVIVPVAIALIISILYGARSFISREAGGAPDMCSRSSRCAAFPAYNAMRSK